MQRDSYLLSHCWYLECPKILYTKVSDKMTYANSADPDQPVPQGAVFAIPLSILRNDCKKSKFRPKKYGIKCLKF